MDEKEVIQSIQSLLINRKSDNDSFEFIPEPQFDVYRPDLIIKAGKRNIAALEIKSSKHLIKSTVNFSTDYYLFFKIRYFIYTNGIIFYFFDRFDNPRKPIKTDSDGFVRRMCSQISQESIRNLKSSAAKIIEEEIRSASNKFPKCLELVSNYSNKIIQELKLAPDYSLYFEGGKTDVDSFEHQFFLKLLDNNIPDFIYRYCSFNRTFQVLNDDTIAMHGLPGMNDTTEPNYIDNYLNETNDNFWDLPPQSIAAINR